MDKYDEAIATLRADPYFREAVSEAWNFPYSFPGGILFLYATPSGKIRDGNGYFCGCLIQVKAGEMPAFKEEVTEAIRNDPGIPSKPEDITPESLQHFARWRRKLDAMVTE